MGGGEGNRTAEDTASSGAGNEAVARTAEARNGPESSPSPAEGTQQRSLHIASYGRKAQACVTWRMHPACLTSGA